MSEYVTISAKVKRELREEARKLGINVSEVLRRALEEEVRRRKIEKLKAELDELSPILEKVSIDRVIKSIREDREER